MKIIGHRGAKGLAPENSLAALRKALEHHVDEIEVDVRVTKDKVPVLTHDPDITINMVSKTVSTHNLAELQELNPDLITLAQALDYLEAKVPLLIEVKPAEETASIVRVLQQYIQHGSYRVTDISLASFSQKTLRELHAALPEVPTVVNERWSGIRGTYRARQLGTKRLNMRSWWLWSGFIRSMARGGYQLSTYTLNDPVKARRWQKAGLYGVITDFPDQYTHTSK